MILSTIRETDPAWDGGPRTTYNLTQCRAYMNDYIAQAQWSNVQKMWRENPSPYRTDEEYRHGPAPVDSRGRSLDLLRMTAPIPLYCMGLMHTHPNILGVILSMEVNLPASLKSYAYRNGDVKFSEVWTRSPTLSHTLFTILSNLWTSPTVPSTDPRRHVGSIQAFVDLFSETLGDLPGGYSCRDHYQANLTIQGFKLGLPLIIDNLHKINLWKPTGLPRAVKAAIRTHYGSHSTTGIQTLGAYVAKLRESEAPLARQRVYNSATPPIKQVLLVSGEYKA